MIRRKWPIRWVLTLWYSGLLLLALLLFGAIIYFGLRHELNDNLNEQHAVQVGVAEAAIQIESGQPMLIWDRSKEGADEQFIRVWNGQSALVADSSDDFTDETLAGLDVDAVLTGQMSKTNSHP